MATCSPGAFIRARRSRSILVVLAALAVVLAIPASSLGITRDVVMERAQRWVDLKVPYSQSKFYEGYRQDCSGYISMAWALVDSQNRPLSLNTRTLPGISSTVATMSMQPGDMFLRVPTETLGGHAILFGGWADAARTKYWALEERNSKTGTIKSIQSVPGPKSGYRARRYSAIDEDYLSYIEPIRDGDDSYRTAIAASRSGWATGSAPTVVVASGMAWADALAGSTLAGVVDGPLLFTETSRLRTDVRAELERLGAKKVYLLGGERTLTPTVASAIGAEGITVKRAGGHDRYATAASVAGVAIAEMRARSISFSGDVYLTTGQNYPDALSIAPIAAHTGRPVLLSIPNRLPDATVRALRSLGAKRVIALGGEVSLTPAVVEAADARVPGTAVRIAGRDRYDAALAIAAHGEKLGVGWQRMGLATGQSFADGLAGGVMLSRTPSLLLLTPGTSLDSRVNRAIRAHKTSVGRVRVIGGMGSVSSPVRRAVAVALGM